MPRCRIKYIYFSLSWRRRRRAHSPSFLLPATPSTSSSLNLVSACFSPLSSAPSHAYLLLLLQPLPPFLVQLPCVDRLSSARPAPALPLLPSRAPHRHCRPVGSCHPLRVLSCQQDVPRALRSGALRPCICLGYGRLAAAFLPSGELGPFCARASPFAFRFSLSFFLLRRNRIPPSPPSSRTSSTSSELDRSCSSNLRM